MGGCEGPMREVQISSCETVLFEVESVVGFVVEETLSDDPDVELDKVETLWTEFDESQES